MPKSGTARPPRNTDPAGPVRPAGRRPGRERLVPAHPKARNPGKGGKGRKGRPAPGSPKPADPYAAQINAATGMKYGGVRRDLGNQVAANVAEGPQTHDYYQQYLQAVNAARQQQQQGTAATLGYVRQNTDASTALDAASARTLLQQSGADAALRGGRVDPQLGQVANQASFTRRADADRFGAMLAGHGRAENAYMADRYRIGGLDELKAQQDRLARGRGLEQKKQDLSREVGQFRTTYKGQLQDAEAKLVLERAAFGLDQQKVALTGAKIAQSAADKAAARRQRAAEDRTKRMQADRKFQLDKQKFGATQAKDNYQKTHGLGSYKPPSSGRGGRRGKSRWATPTSQRATTRKIDEVLRHIKEAKAHGAPDAKIRQILSSPPSGSGISPYDPLLINAALELRHLHHITGKTRNALNRAYGLQVRHYYKVGPGRKKQRPDPVRRAANTGGNLAGQIGAALGGY